MQLSRTKFRKSFILSTKNGLSASPGKIRSIRGENLEISLEVLPRKLPAQRRPPPGLRAELQADPRPSHIRAANKALTAPEEVLEGADEGSEGILRLEGSAKDAFADLLGAGRRTSVRRLVCCCRTRAAFSMGPAISAFSSLNGSQAVSRASRLYPDTGGAPNVSSTDRQFPRHLTGLWSRQRSEAALGSALGPVPAAYVSELVVSPNLPLHNERLPFFVSRGRVGGSQRRHCLLRPPLIHAHSSVRGVCGSGTTRT